MPSGMHALDLLGDPVRRRVLELLVAGERPSGEIVAAIQHERGLSQPAVAAHLRALREGGVVHVRAEGTRRLYAIDGDGLREADRWLEPFRAFWERRLDALATEIARGKKKRKKRRA